LWARGGLISYGPNNTNQFHRAADYVDKILRGTKPADIPVEQPTKFELVINLTTAKTLGLAVPESLLLRNPILGASHSQRRNCANRAFLYCGPGVV
jgi:putative tryptophan/tyrosine transport system substrate-binding protein